MKRIESIFTADRGRGPAALTAIAVMMLTVAITTLVVLNGGKSSVVADSLPAPIASIPQNPETRNSVFVRITVDSELLESETVFQDRIEWTNVLEYNASITRTAERGTSISTGRSLFNPIVFTKYVDRISPRLMEALRRNQPVEAVFEFERPNFDTGSPETYYKVEVLGGSVAGIQKNFGLIGGDTETISLAFNTIIETDEIDGITDAWQWSSAN